MNPTPVEVSSVVSVLLSFDRYVRQKLAEFNLLPPGIKSALNLGADRAALTSLVTNPGTFLGTGILPHIFIAVLLAVFKSGYVSERHWKDAAAKAPLRQGVVDILHSEPVVQCYTVSQWSQLS